MYRATAPMPSRTRITIKSNMMDLEQLAEASIDLVKCSVQPCRCLSSRAECGRCGGESPFALLRRFKLLLCEHAACMRTGSE